MELRVGGRRDAGTQPRKHHGGSTTTYTRRTPSFHPISYAFGKHAVLLAALLLLLILPACATRHNPHYNRFAPRDGRPSLLDHVEHATDTVDQALDNFDERLNNIVW